MAIGLWFPIAKKHYYIHMNVILFVKTTDFALTVCVKACFHLTWGQSEFLHSSFVTNVQTGASGFSVLFPPLRIVQQRRKVTLCVVSLCVRLNKPETRLLFLKMPSNKLAISSDLHSSSDKTTNRNAPSCFWSFCSSGSLTHAKQCVCLGGRAGFCFCFFSGGGGG